MSTHLVALHMGALHPAEQVLTLVLAFGPFVVLGAVVARRRRHESDEDPARSPRVSGSGSHDRRRSRP